MVFVFGSFVIRGDFRAACRCRNLNFTYFRDMTMPVFCRLNTSDFLPMLMLTHYLFNTSGIIAELESEVDRALFRSNILSIEVLVQASSEVAVNLVLQVDVEL